MRPHFQLLVLLLLLTPFVTSQGAPNEDKDLSVLSGWIRWADASTLLPRHLAAQASDHLIHRKQLVAELNTAEDWQRRQQQVKELLNYILGPFPDRTPLNPVITGVIEKNGYRVERIIFESMPQFYVTGCLFIPDSRQGKTAAILNPIGHTDIAFRAPYYQQVIINLVRKGFIVLAIDPVGQGERLQYYDPEQKKSLVGGPTSEHSHFGRQCFLNGVSSARYFVWDGIRAIDYLLTREEVDPDRIAVTGLSGGGTQTAYISAVDDRVAVSAPACYITSFRRLLESIGPQDAEQNFYRGISLGLDHADFIEVRAPKPTLIIATTRDFFSIQGTRETFNEAKRAYTALGAGENVDMVEDDHTHGYTKKTREALYAFMQKHLSTPGDPTDQDIEPLTPEELTVTATGQVLTALNSQRVFDYNKIDTQNSLARLQKQRGNLAEHLAAVKRDAVQVSGYRASEERSSFIFMGGIQREGYRIEKFVIETEGQCIVPVLTFVPQAEGAFPAVIYLRPDGKAKDALEGGFIEQLIKNQFLVAAADLSGLGEVGDSVSGIKSPFTCVLIGRSLPGIHAGEIVRLAKFIRSREDVLKDKLAVVAYSHLGPASLHAAAIEPFFSHIALVRPLISYESVATNAFYKTPGWIEVPGALRAYDLPDLTACIPPRPLLIVSPTDASLSLASEEETMKAYEVTIAAYRTAQTESNLTITPGVQDDTEIQSKLNEWLIETMK